MEELFVICRDIKHSIWLYREFIRQKGDKITKTNSHTREVEFNGACRIRFLTEERSDILLKGVRDVKVVNAREFERRMKNDRC